MLAEAGDILCPGINVQSLELAGNLGIQHRVNGRILHTPRLCSIVRKPHRAVKLGGEIKYPLAQVGLVLQVQHPFVSAGHRPLYGLGHVAAGSLDHYLRIGVPEGQQRVEMLVEIERQVGLQGVGGRLRQINCSSVGLIFRIGINLMRKLGVEGLKTKEAGIFLTYRANRDSIEFNFDTIKQKLVALNAKLKYLPGETKTQRLKRIFNDIFHKNKVT